VNVSQLKLRSEKFDNNNNIIIIIMIYFKFTWALLRAIILKWGEETNWMHGKLWIMMYYLF
jgi:hypothetical protein